MAAEKVESAIASEDVCAIASFAISQEIILKYFSTQYWTLQNCMQLNTIPRKLIKSKMVEKDLEMVPNHSHMVPNDTQIVLNDS